MITDRTTTDADPANCTVDNPKLRTSENPRACMDDRPPGTRVLAWTIGGAELGRPCAVRLDDATPWDPADRHHDDLRRTANETTLSAVAHGT